MIEICYKRSKKAQREYHAKQRRDKAYKDRVDKSDKRWLDTENDEVFDGIVKYLNGFL